ncbi:MAG: hypothetical protein SGI90_09605 [Candidatus Eisenbacteria bacterium]|nr:hypothetical protein [Candidatus Eisenbacteria bacterium]
MYERLVASELREGKKSLLLLGPRQVGKSTLLRSLKPDTVLNLADPELFRAFVARPERLRSEEPREWRSCRSRTFFDPWGGELFLPYALAAIRRR